eukprot:GHVO01029703.1.p1 GENE.GHVO01029703.1~~GHVO01029703.1.p1  ORF type:complete len:213 (-),score=31.03 GHVO01029703.1:504-1142(-)
MDDLGDLSRIDYGVLGERFPPLKQFLIKTRKGYNIDYHNTEALRRLTAALFFVKYGYIWELPASTAYICPPLPSRLSYVHIIGTLLTVDNGSDGGGKIAVTGRNIIGIDIGVGANCVYSLLCVGEYGWHMVGIDTDEDALRVAKENVTRNQLDGYIDLRVNKDPLTVFEGTIGDKEKYSFCMCNPPFHESIEEMNSNPKRWTTRLFKQLPRS